MTAEQLENLASDLLGHFGPVAVETRMEPAADIRMVVAVVVGNSPVVVEGGQIDHHRVDSDNLAEELGCKVG